MVIQMLSRYSLQTSSTSYYTALVIIIYILILSDYVIWNYCHIFIFFNIYINFFSLYVIISRSFVFLGHKYCLLLGFANLAMTNHVTEWYKSRWRIVPDMKISHVISHMTNTELERFHIWNFYSTHGMGTFSHM